MKKKFLSIVTALVLVLTMFASCGGSNDAEGFDVNKEITVVTWEEG